MLILCSYRSGGKQGRTTLCACHYVLLKHLTRSAQVLKFQKSLFIIQKTWNSILLLTSWDVWVTSVRHCLRRCLKVFKFVCFHIGGCFNDKKTLHPSLACFMKKIIEVEASVGRSSLKELVWKFSKIFKTATRKSNCIFMQCLLSKKRMGYSKT